MAGYIWPAVNLWRKASQEGGRRGGKERGREEEPVNGNCADSRFA